MEDARSSGSLEVPMHLRNAPTKFMQGQGYGDGYRYAHDEADGFAAGESYFPDELEARQYYHPVERGLEIKIAQKLEQLRNRNRDAKS
jgi:putative ATPase